MGMVSGLRLNPTAEEEFGRSPLFSGANEAYEFLILGGGGSEPLEGRRFASANASAPVDAEVRASAGSPDREPLARKLRGNAFSDSSDVGDVSGLVGNVKPEVLNTFRKGLSSRDAGFNHGGFGRLRTLINVIHPSFGNHERMESAVHVEEDPFKQNPGELLGAPATGHGRPVWLNGRGVRPTDTEQPRGQVLEEEQDELDRREVVFFSGLEDFEHVKGVEKLLDIPKVTRRTNAVGGSGFVVEGAAKGLDKGRATRDGVIPGVSRLLNPLVQTVATHP